MIETLMLSGDESHRVDRSHEMSAIGARTTLVSLLVAASERAPRWNARFGYWQRWG